MRTAINVATWNIQHGKVPGGGVDVDGLREEAARLGVDLLALQEVDVGVPRSGRADEAAIAADGTGMAHEFAPAIRREGVGRYGNALLTGGTITDVTVARLPRHERSERRVALLATVIVDGMRVSVAVTHLSIRPLEARAQLDATLASLHARPEPRLLLGDLNLEPPVVEPMVQAIGLTLAGGDATFPAWAPRRRIDHIAVSGLHLGAVRTVHLAVGDHRALTANLRR